MKLFFQPTNGRGARRCRPRSARPFAERAPDDSVPDLPGDPARAVAGEAALVSHAVPAVRAQARADPRRVYAQFFGHLVRAHDGRDLAPTAAATAASLLGANPVRRMPRPRVDVRQIAGRCGSSQQRPSSGRNARGGGPPARSASCDRCRFLTFHENDLARLWRTHPACVRLQRGFSAVNFLLCCSALQAVRVLRQVRQSFVGFGASP